MMHDTPLLPDSPVPGIKVLDLIHEKCPMTFVRTRLALDSLPSGGTLAVRLQGAEPLKNVKRSVLALGHLVLGEQPERDTIVILTVQKK
ncbi:MAG: sulfurtransferase TusA family protein [Acetobacter orientalis]|uniref:sulfurtransferase TusA family protein n=1 Tax=Acetobacter orientalis TaxID=146474 RepID=UPI0039E7EA08